MAFKSMLNEIAQDLPALNLTAVIIVFGIGFLRLVYKVREIS